jgi:uncharacterized cupredoxin-like copper-binding protein
MRVRSVLACAVLTATLAGPGLAACSSSDNGKSIDVSLLDYAVRPKVSSMKSGDVTFKVKNNGGFVHEFVVDRSHGKPLPTKPDGEVNEAAISDADHLGEVEDIAPGDTKELKVTMSPGTYVLFCNRVDGKISHYAKGMHTDFTVTGS